MLHALVRRMHHEIEGRVMLGAEPREDIVGVGRVGQGRLLPKEQGLLKGEDGGVIQKQQRVVKGKQQLHVHDGGGRKGLPQAVFPAAQAVHGVGGEDEHVGVGKVTNAMGQRAQQAFGRGAGDHGDDGDGGGGALGKAGILHEAAVEEGQAPRDGGVHVGLIICV